jgi:hypothetical protein
MDHRFPLSSEPPLTEQEVYYAFRFAFGREPRQVDIDWHRRHASFEAMRRLFVESPEFRLERGMMPAPAGRRVAVEMDNGACIWVTLDDRFVTSGIVAGNWEPLETRFIASRLAPGSVFLDVGAFLGWFTIIAAPIVGPTGAVLAFEPQSEAHALLRRSVLANRFEPWVSTFDVALSNAAGEVALWRDAIPDGQRTGNLGHTWIGDAGHPAARPAASTWSSSTSRAPSGWSCRAASEPSAKAIRSSSANSIRPSFARSAASTARISWTASPPGATALT